MVAYTTSTYNTGWMNGDIKGAFLSDTDDTDLVGSGELVTNGIRIRRGGPFRGPQQTPRPQVSYREQLAVRLTSLLIRL
jgi:hypothetical protein